jgi:L-seryl-tRNA(Ser) seleniumtransferase
MTSPLASLPAVHRLLAHPRVHGAVGRFGRDAVRQAARTTIEAARRAVLGGAGVASLDALAEETLDRLAAAAAPAYPPVINATGVLVHTNLGRAPRLAAHAAGYLALELDLSTGERGERLAPVASRLRRYFGAEAATVLTNNAAALFLLLAVHAAGREVVVSRGELIEIGGSFRLPEIMAAAGARLVEVGCTNRTHLTDYERAVSPDTAAVLVVHRSNFHIEGFVATPELAQVVGLAAVHALPVWVDQGSGCHCDLAPYGLRHEPTVQEVLAAGADAVLFSGDKLLGGPQAGIVVGSGRTLDPLRRHPLRRALRPDKSALATLAATLDAYLAGRLEDVPLFALLATPPESLRTRARSLARRIRRAGHAARAVPCRAVIGGGSTPDQTLPSWAIELDGENAVAARLRASEPPVVARVEGGRVLVDLRAVFPEEDGVLAAAVIAALAENASNLREDR